MADRVRQRAGGGDQRQEDVRGESLTATRGCTMWKYEYEYDHENVDKKITTGVEMDLSTSRSCGTVGQELEKSDFYCYESEGQIDAEGAVRARQRETTVVWAAVLRDIHENKIAQTSRCGNGVATAVSQALYKMRWNGAEQLVARRRKDAY